MSDSRLHCLRVLLLFLVCCCACRRVYECGRGTGCKLAGGESCDESVRRARIFLDRGRSCCRSFGWCGGRDSGDFTRIGCLHVSLIYLSLDYSHFFESTIKTIVARRGEPTWPPSTEDRTAEATRGTRESSLSSVSMCLFIFFDSFLFTGDSAYLVRILLGRTLKFRRIQVCDVLVPTFD